MPTNVDVTTYTCREKITWHFEHLIMAHKYQKMLENVKQRNGKLKMGNRKMGNRNMGNREMGDTKMGNRNGN